MATDNIGTPVSAGDLCLLAGQVRHIEGDTLVIVTADGRHAFRVKASDTRKVDTVVDPAGLDDVTSDIDGKQPLNANLTAFAGLAGAADKVPKFTGSGTMVLIDLSTFALAAAGAFTTAAPSSAVAASSSNHLMRKAEVDTAVATKQAAATRLTQLVSATLNDGDMISYRAGNFRVLENPGEPSEGNRWRLGHDGALPFWEEEAIP